MLPRSRRLCALFLAMLYLSFAGGMTLFHRHGGETEVAWARAVRASAPADGVTWAGVSHLTGRSSAPSQCPACFWVQQVQVRPPAQTSPLPPAVLGTAHESLPVSCPSPTLARPSSRAPPSV